MSIVITTPTGNIGSRAAQLLIQAGERPTLLVRNASRLSEDVRKRSDVIEGDLSNAEFVLQATKDAKALFWLTPSNYRAEDPVGESLRLGAIVAQAVKQNGIGHTILLSSQGAESRGGDFIGALGQTEDLLNATGANVIHLRPGYFFTNLFMDLEQLKQGVLTTTIPLDLPVAWNDPRDIGDIVAALLLSRNWSGQSVQTVSGPRDLTYSEVASIVSDATGKPIQAIRLSDEEARAGMLGAGLNAATTEAFLGMSHRIAKGTDSSRSYISTTPTGLEGWAYVNLRPALNPG